MKSIMSRGLDLLEEVEAKTTAAKIPESTLRFCEAMARLSVEEKQMFCRFFRDLGYVELAALLSKDALQTDSSDSSAEADPEPVVLARRESLEHESAVQKQREAPTPWRAPQPLASLMFPLIPGQGFGPPQVSPCATQGVSNPKAEPGHTPPAAQPVDSPRAPVAPILAGIHPNSAPGTPRATPAKDPARSRRGAWGGASFASRDRGASVTPLRSVPTTSDKNKPPRDSD